MSYIPSQAMPHAYVHEDADEDENRRDADRNRSAEGPRLSNGVMLGGAVVLTYMLYRALR